MILLRKICASFMTTFLGIILSYGAVAICSLRNGWHTDIVGVISGLFGASAYGALIPFTTRVWILFPVMREEWGMFIELLFRISCMIAGIAAVFASLVAAKGSSYALTNIFDLKYLLGGAFGILWISLSLRIPFIKSPSRWISYAAVVIITVPIIFLMYHKPPTKYLENVGTITAIVYGIIFGLSHAIGWNTLKKGIPDLYKLPN